MSLIYSDRKLGLWLLGLLEDGVSSIEIAKSAFELYSNEKISKSEKVEKVLYQIMLMEAGDEFIIPKSELEAVGLQLVNGNSNKIGGWVFNSD